MPPNNSPTVIKRKSRSPQQIVFKSNSKSFKLFLKFIEMRSKKEDFDNLDLDLDDLDLDLDELDLDELDLDELDLDKKLKKDLDKKEPVYINQNEEVLQFQLDL